MKVSSPPRRAVTFACVAVVGIAAIALLVWFDDSRDTAHPERQPNVADKYAGSDPLLPEGQHGSGGGVDDATRTTELAPTSNAPVVQEPADSDLGGSTDEQQPDGGAGDAAEPRYPESIPIAGEILSNADIQRAIDAGLPVVMREAHLGPLYDDDGDLLFIKRKRPHAVGIRLHYTWGAPLESDLPAMPPTHRLIEDFGVWMPRDDGRYEFGFTAADGRFFRYGTGRSSFYPRQLEGVPEGRAIPRVGSLSVFDIPLQCNRPGYARVRGGYAIPGFIVLDNPETAEVENMFITFEGYPRIAMDRLTWLWQRYGRFDLTARGGPPPEYFFFKMWQRNPEVVVIPRPPE